MAWRELSRGAQTAIEASGVSALVIVGLLNGACGSSGGSYYVEPERSGHCWRPGVCRDVSASTSCAQNEDFEEGEPCTTLLRVGACVSEDGLRTYLYAPLHAFGTPDCAPYAGAGSHFERE